MLVLAACAAALIGRPAHVRTPLPPSEPGGASPASTEATPVPPVWAATLGPVPLEDQLEVGDIVFLAGETWGGRIIRAIDDAEYTHCGIIAEHEGRRVFVHSSPITIDLSATVAADSLTELIWSGAYPKALVLRPDADAASRARIARTASSLVGVPYDGGFDLFDPSRIYCTELVLVAFERENLTLLEDPMSRAKHVPIVGERVLFPDALLDSPALRPAPEATKLLQDAADLRQG